MIEYSLKFLFLFISSTSLSCSRNTDIIRTQMFQIFSLPPCLLGSQFLLHVRITCWALTARAWAVPQASDSSVLGKDSGLVWCRDWRWIVFHSSRPGRSGSECGGSGRTRVLRIPDREMQKNKFHADFRWSLPGCFDAQLSHSFTDRGQAEWQDSLCCVAGTAFWVPSSGRDRRPQGCKS